jgi:hypothetical protein
MVSNGRQLALAWTQGLQNQRSGFDVSVEVLDATGLPQTAPVIVESVTSQRNPAITTNGTDDFVVWLETDGIYGSRVSRGLPLDGRGIRISDDVARVVRVAYDEPDQTYVVAWTAAGGELRMRRIAAVTGALFPQSAALAACASNFDILGDHSGVLAVFTDCHDGTSSLLHVGAAGADGGPFAFTPPGMRTTSPRIASNGVEYLIVWTEMVPGSSPSQWPAFRENVYATRVSRSLSVLDVQPIAIALSNSDWDADIEPIAASDGTDFIIAWQKLRDLNERIHVRHLSTDGVLLDGVASDSGVELEADGHVDSVVWDGQRYALAFTRRIAWSHLVYMTHIGRNADDRPVNDRIDLSVNAPDQSDAVLLSRGNGRVTAVYARVATESLYGGVMRIFERDPIPPPRVRAVRR